MTTWTDDEAGGSVFSDDEVGTNDGLTSLTGALTETGADTLRIFDVTSRDFRCDECYPEARGNAGSDDE